MIETDGANISIIKANTYAIAILDQTKNISMPKTNAEYVTTLIDMLADNKTPCVYVNCRFILLYISSMVRPLVFMLTDD